MRKTTSAIMATIVGAGTAVLISSPAAAATPNCNTVITPAHMQGFYQQQAVFDANDVDVTGGSSQGYVGKAIAERALTTRQADYSIKTEDGRDVYKPGFAYYLGIDQDGNSTTADPIDNLFYEPQSYGEGVWHSGAPGGSGGYAFMGTLAEFKAANPQAKITEFDANYGPGLAADDTVEMQTLTFQRCTYTFVLHNRPPNATFTLNNAGDTDYRTFGFDARNSSDPEHQALTYSWKFGDGTTGHGAVVQHTYPAAKGKSYFATLTVSDGVNHTSTTRKVLVS
jgi:hypothetical protein